MTESGSIETNNIPELSVARIAKAGGEVLSERSNGLTPPKKGILQRVGGINGAMAILLASQLFFPAVATVGIFQQITTAETSTPTERILERIRPSSRFRPEHYTFPPGTTPKVDLDKVREIQEKAIKNQEPELIKILDISSSIETSTQNPPPYTPSAEHPRIMELPKGVLPDQERAAKGIDIIQSPKTNLYIKESAFQKGGIFESFNNGQNKLVIVLVDGPVLSPRYMHDSRYDSVRWVIERNWPEKSRLKKIDEIEDTISSLRKDLTYWEEEVRDGDKESFMMGNPSLYLKGTKEEILKLKIEREIYRTADEDLLTRLLDEGHDPGLFFIEPWNPLNPLAVSKSIIFIATGNGSHKIEGNLMRFITSFFDEHGDVVFYSQILPLGSNLDLSPMPSQTFPDLADVKMRRNPNIDSYIVNVGSAGQLLAHETEHWRLIVDIPNRTGGPPNYSEKKPDEQLLERFKKGDYPFVFSIPKKNGGGYIVTEINIKFLNNS